MNSFTGIDMHNIYSELMKTFIKHGHHPYIVTPREKKLGKETKYTEYENYGILEVQTGNMSGVTLIEKGISTVMLNSKYYKAILKYLGNVKFELILYSTPPITLVCTIKKLKRNLQCTTYLMLKDIFPQNAVDLEMFTKKSPIYFYFRIKEKALYKYSDMIGCMSQANCDYIAEHNPQISKECIEVCPNSIIPTDLSVDLKRKVEERKRLGLPINKVIFVYGGNLGRPQNVPFIVKCLRICAGMNDVHFVIAGSGTEKHFLDEYMNLENPTHVTVFNHMPKEQYDALTSCCDVGLIFLDYRFTIPNFPSRLITYMQAGLPVFACTDRNTDIGQVVMDGQFGWWCESSDKDMFYLKIKEILSLYDDLQCMGRKAFEYLAENYDVENCYVKIMKNITT